MNGYIYPNEANVVWTVMIVIYPYITGLVAGAFIISALYHVFNQKVFKPVSKLALVSALSLLLVAPIPLLLHLSQPLRAFNIMLTPNPSSAMAGFGYIYSFYLMIVLLEIWFIYRKNIVTMAEKSAGLSKIGYGLLSLGAKDLSPGTLAMDNRIINTLAVIGIPAAFGLHGYVGFIFGGIKANPWWSSPLMPVIFIASAVVSGTALLILVYGIGSRLRKREPDHQCMTALNKYLWIFLIVAVSLEALEIVNAGYQAKSYWPAVYGLLTQQIPLSFFGIQLLLGGLVPLILLPAARLKSFAREWQQRLTMIAAGLIVVGVFAMRWNVVIGGQLLSKTGMGYSGYVVPLLGREGLLMAVVVLILPIILFSVLSQIFPPWPKDEAAISEQIEVSKSRPELRSGTVG
ncbi:MAG: polysulfide reductase NrfD [Clostridia bacterium]|nr:polysulfide reductase NrfD [Clostridia bacterium]